MRGKRVKVGEGEGIRERAWSGKGGLHGERRQIPRRKERESKKSLPRMLLFIVSTSLTRHSYWSLILRSCVAKVVCLQANFCLSY